MEGRLDETRDDMFEVYPLPIVTLGASEDDDAIDLNAWLRFEEDVAFLEDWTADEATEPSGLVARGEAVTRGG